MARRRPSSRLRVRAAVLACGLVLAGLGAHPARADPPVWRVIGPKAQVELFGSIHLLPSATRWMTPALQRELDGAQALYFEIPLDAESRADAQALIRGRGLLPEGEKLSSELPPRLWTRMQALAKRDGLNPAMLERMRPWLAELTLTVGFYQRAGYSQDLGVESRIDAAAPPTAERDAFETLDQQISLLADGSQADQIASLKETLDEIGADPGLFERAADAWRRGDVQGLIREVIDPMRKEDAEVYRRLIVERNRRFATKIEAIARGGGPARVFVVLGVGHLVGPEGVPTLLRRDGLEVEGP